MRSQTYREVRQKSIRELEEQLKALKEREKVYLKLTKKVKDLQEKSKNIKKATEEISNETLENEQIDRLKFEIQKTIAETKKIEEDNKVIKSQSKTLQLEIKALTEVQSTLCNENKTKRQRIQLLDQQLSEKQAQLDNLLEKKNCNELVIEQLRADIARLQGEEEQLSRQLEKLRLQRQQEQKEKEILKNNVDLLKNEIQQQQTNYKNYKFKLSQIKQGNHIIKEQLLTLIHLEEKLKAQLQKSASSYQNIVVLQGQSSNKLKLMQDELKIAEQDLQSLTEQYIRQAQNLRQQQQTNQKLNNQIDQTAKETFEVWQSVKELIELNQGQNSQLKMKAYRIWFQISQILDIK